MLFSEIRCESSGHLSSGPTVWRFTPDGELPTQQVADAGHDSVGLGTALGIAAAVEGKKWERLICGRGIAAVVGEHSCLIVLVVL